MTDFNVDFIAFDERDACLMVRVEQGPWTEPVDDHLRKLQDWLYGCLEAALDGQVAAQFPRSSGLNFVLRVDCYEVPVGEVRDFIRHFEEGLSSLPDYSTSDSAFVRNFTFEVEEG